MICTMKTEAQKRAQAKYEKSGAQKRIVFKLSVNNDADIIAFLETKNNVSGYLKNLIKDDMGSSLVAIEEASK